MMCSVEEVGVANNRDRESWFISCLFSGEVN